MLTRHQVMILFCLRNLDKMFHAGSTCTIKQLFAIFGASVRRGEQGFSVELIIQDNTHPILTGVKWDESGPFYDS